MREAQHPIKPAFDKAQDKREAWRQQQLAKLNDEQRAQYQEILDRQRVELDSREKDLDGQRQDAIADAMRKQLSHFGQPRYQMGGPSNSPHLHDLKRARDAVDDHLKGNDTPDTRRYAAILHDAQSKAEKQVAHDHQQTLQNHQLKQQNDRDRFLREIEKDRRQADKTEQFRDSAKDMTQRSVSDQFNKEAQDRSLREAIEKVAEQAAARQLEQEHDLEHDPSR